MSSAPEHDGRRTSGGGPDAGGAARILIVAGDPSSRDRLADHLRRRRHTCTPVGRLDEAHLALGNGRFDLVLLNPALPDGDGLDVARRVRHLFPLTKTVVFSERRSFRAALRAMRCGAVDFVAAGDDLDALDALAVRVERALVKSHAEQQREARIRRLHRICRELKAARRDISDQVDALCQDLGSAYRDLSDQIGDMTMATEFRTLLRQELDVEEVLRTMLEYLLSKTGPTNAAVFLPDRVDRHFGLGAYVNYDCPRESIDTLLEHLGRAICPQMADETELVAFDDADEFAEWIGLRDGFLAHSQVLAFCCAHEGECLGVVVLFRKADTPFDPSLAGTLDIIRSIFAEQLGHIIRVHHRAHPDWPKDAHEGDDFEEDDYGFGFAA